ncbi:MAG: 30S ribosomal protein S4 [Bdellovibrionales bacterium]|nr:30S ribosomal protein S4 [Bdellovibrionales bacterium]
MSQVIESACKVCRRELTKLFLKGDRCYTDKCAIDRRGYPPGQHGQGRTKASNYGIQLREKQKIRRLYGIHEKQFRKYFHEAERRKGITGTNLLLILEQRLDNMVYRSGFASSRSEGRQLISHGHIMVDGKRVTCPSYQLKMGQEISVVEKSRQKSRINLCLDAVERRGLPAWVELNKTNYTATIKGIPAREDLTMPMQEQLVVELYSK